MGSWRIARSSLSDAAEEPIQRLRGHVVIEVGILGREQPELVMPARRIRCTSRPGRVSLSRRRRSV